MVKEFKVERILGHKSHVTWKLQVTDDLLRFEGPHDEIIELSAFRSLNQLHLPSFFASRTEIIVGDEESRSAPRFKADSKVISELKNWYRNAEGRQHPEHIENVRRTVTFHLIAGIVLVVVGLAGTYAVTDHFSHFGGIFENVFGMAAGTALGAGMILTIKSIVDMLKVR